LYIIAYKNIQRGWKWLIQDIGIPWDRKRDGGKRGLTGMRISVCLESTAHIADGVIADAAFGMAGFHRGGRPGAFRAKHRVLSGW
jgi:hypothetical protein